MYCKIILRTKYLYLVYILCLKFVHILDRKPNLEKNYIYSNKFFHNFHFSESSFTFPGHRASGLVRKLGYIPVHLSIFNETYIRVEKKEFLTLKIL